MEPLPNVDSSEWQCDCACHFNPDGPAMRAELDIALRAVLAERERQDAKWGEQNHEPVWWLAILGEEYGELCQAVLESHFDNGTDKGGFGNVYNEATQVAAVALALLERLNRGWRP
jgi:NTP pyrophosphatase (non-canonical NTP hydrolase)